MTAARALALALAATTGVVTVAGFAPFGFAHLPVVTLALLFAQWNAAPSRRDAAELGLAFGLGLFGAGTSWVYIALETFGGMPTAIAMIATAGMVVYLALWPAIAGYLAVRFTARQSVARVVAAAALWTLCEWLRGWLFTGMPWLSLGYAELPGSTLAGYAPIGGVFLVSLAVALIAAMVALIFDALSLRRCWRIAGYAAIGVALYVGGAVLTRTEWTRPDGAPLAVSLVQGNIPQDVKFDPEFRERTFRIYAKLVEQSRGKLIVLPESAYPMFSDEVPDRVLLQLARTGNARGGDVLLGLFTAEAPLPGADEPRYFNTVVTLGSSGLQLYRKRHLVPFGETIPLKPILGWLIRSVLAIPIADQTPGEPKQAPLAVAGTRVAVNICYEDAFGAELISGAEAARILINVTNDAWYGHSIAAWQHNQIAAMRALELGRPLLRATNTGVTSAIGHNGRVIAELPWFTSDVLETNVQGRAGATPYQRIADWPAVGVAFALAIIACWPARKRAA